VQGFRVVTFDAEGTV